MGSLPAADHHLHLPRHLFTTNFRTSRSSRPSYFQPTMASSISWSARLTIAAVFLLGLCQHAAAQYTVPYCATFNTADSGTRNESPPRYLAETCIDEQPCR